MPASPAYPGSCADFRAAARLDRRELLRVGALSGFGLSLPDLFRAQGQARPDRPGTFGRAKSVIVLYLHGGHAQQETLGLRRGRSRRPGGAEKTGLAGRRPTNPSFREPQRGGIQ